MSADNALSQNRIDLQLSPGYPKLMKVSAQYAEEHFADILHAADNGEAVEIARPDKPALFLAPRTVATAVERKSPRVLGAGRGKIVLPSWEEWKTMDKETEREMLDAPFLTTGEI